MDKRDYSMVGTTHHDHMFKSGLLSIAKLYTKPKQYKIGRMLQENGQEVLRLPPSATVSLMLLKWFGPMRKIIITHIYKQLRGWKCAKNVAESIRKMYERSMTNSSQKIKVVWQGSGHRGGARPKWFVTDDKSLVLWLKKKIL